MEYKFKIGDRVKIVCHGNGYGIASIGEEVTILELGRYNGKIGYRTSETKSPDSNSNNGRYDYMCGEKSFELVQSRVLQEHYEVF